MSYAWHEIRDHLMQSSSTLQFQRNFETIRSRHGAIAEFREPTALLDTLHQQSSGADRKNRVLTALVRAGQRDDAEADCALLLMLLALWPGLDAIRRRSVWRRIGTADEIASDILARTTEVVRGLDLERVSRVASTVLRNVERDMIRAHRREAERQSAASDVDPDELPADQGAQDSALSHSHLHEDMRRLIGADAALVIRVAIEGFSQAEVAIELGLSEAAARKRYQRATRKLRDLFPENF